MSVDHYDCACCNENGVYEEYIACCEECGQMICSHCIVNELEIDDRPYIYNYHNEDGSLKKEHCPFCSGDKVSDNQRLNFLLSYLNCILEIFNIPNKVTIEDIDKYIIDKSK